MSTREKVARLFQICVFFPLYLILKVIFRFEVRGQESLRGISPRQAIIFASNHYGPFDGVITAVAIAMPWNGFKIGNFLPIRYLAYADYFRWIQFSGPFPFPISIFVSVWLKLSACIPIKCRRKDQIGKVFIEDVLAPAIKVLNQGGRVFIFPEGKMSPNGTLQKGKRGVVCMQKETGAPIIPMYLHGTFKMFSWENLKKRRVSVSFGEPLDNLVIHEDCELQDMSDCANLVMEEIAGLAKTLNGGEK
ncbi:MAG: lysophospholipid acyltransferase family protein [Candidatus Moraniibacteriota bacterium]